MIMFKRKLQQQQIQRKARGLNQINTAEGSRSGSKLTRAQQRRQHDSVGALPSQYGGNTPHQNIGASSEDLGGDLSRDMKSEITIPGSLNSINIVAQFNINSKILREQMLFGEKVGMISQIESNSKLDLKNVKPPLPNSNRPNLEINSGSSTPNSGFKFNNLDSFKQMQYDKAKVRSQIKEIKNNKSKILQLINTPIHLQLAS